MKISECIPSLGLSLASYKGAELIDRIGEETVKEVVINVLCGSNVRSLTEKLTRKRIALSNASLLVAFLNASKHIPNFSKNYTSLIQAELKRKRALTKEQKIYLNWMIGLTGKSVQNVLRGEQDDLDDYITELNLSINSTSTEAKEAFGEIKGSFFTDKLSLPLTWEVITQLFMAIGTQTLALRGSEKSMYGKIFEKFILGSVLTILGFEKYNEHSKDNMIFWLSDRGDKRESDATAIIAPGKGVRFDIGFIGPGNTEISLDKVSRFETEMQHGRQVHYMSTLVIVDRIGEGSRINEMAEKIGGQIIQMSMSCWVKEVAINLNKKAGFKHKILKMSDEESIEWVRTQMKSVNLKDFI